MTQKTRRFGNVRAGVGLAASFLMLVFISGTGVVAFGQQSPPEPTTEVVAAVTPVVHPDETQSRPSTVMTEPESPRGVFRQQESHQEEPGQQEPYEVHMLDAPPRLMNVAAAVTRMRTLYPQALLDAGISGKVLVSLVIGPDGTVVPESIKVEESTNADFNGPSVRLVEQFRFEAGKVDGVAVHTAVMMPIAWHSEL